MVNKAVKFILVKYQLQFFFFPADEDLRKCWIIFANKKDLNHTTSLVICIKHFENKNVKKKIERKIPLVKSLKPIPTLNSASLATHENSVLLPTYSKPRKSTFE